MKTKKTGWKWLGAALLATLGLCGRAQAGTTAYLNIDVTISGSKSVTVNTVATSTDTSSVNWTTANQVVVGGTVTVQNNSGVLAEGWELSTNQNSLATSGGSWTLSASSTSVGTEAFSLQAVFGSSTTTTCSAGDTNWTKSAIAPLLSTTLTPYTATTFADTTLTGTGGSFAPDNGTSMYVYNAATGAGDRALCWRLILPTSTVLTATQNIQVVVTAY